MANFCKYCGRPLQDGELCSCPQAQAEAAQQYQGQQPFQGGYQQPPQGGYQQPPQGGYQQPPQGGYQQPPQGGYQQPPYQQPYAQPAYDPYDHTAEFDPQDISDNKVIAMLVYLMGAIGVLIALLASQSSPYVMFHVRQSLKIIVVSTLLSIIMVVLIWTVLVPIACGIAFVVLFVVNIICFFQVCSGKAKEPAVIRSLNFLR